MTRETLAIIEDIVALRDRLADRADRELLADACSVMSKAADDAHQLDYAYGRIAYGFQYGDFDFSVLRQRAQDHVAKAVSQ